MIKKLFQLFMIASILSCNTSNEKKEYIVKNSKDNNGFTYEEVTNDPTGLRLYTLENGLKVYLSKNTDEPKIQTYIAVRAGSNYDPEQSTGLAHYLEHMLFKGTDKIGTLDWDKEKEFIEKISDLYEQHRAEKDEEKKKEIYEQIDAVSLKASNYSIANEYDKMISSLGATGTNAHTWFEETVYKNKIPANELNKWLALEVERFNTLVLRLFHTELEAVFEEFNKGQDNDFRKKYKAMLEGLFPTHPYGQQTTIGKAEHLKNPSMIDIHNYFDTYYVPNNMAIILVGDLDFDKTITEVNKTFGQLKQKPLSHPDLPDETPIQKPVIKEVYGPTAANITIAYRTKGISSNDKKYIKLCDMILSNGSAGLIDLDLNQNQLVQGARSSVQLLNDYGYQILVGTPKTNQSLDDVKELLLNEVEKLKNGEFEDWMIEAVVNDLKLSQITNQQNNTSLAGDYMNTFIHREEWKDQITFLEDLKRISKEELVDFANQFYKENYVVVYKRQGEDKNSIKVENPGITPVNLNRNESSAYLQAFNEIESGNLEPKFIDYKTAIKETELNNGVEVSYIKNELNDLFDLTIIFDMGKDNDKKISLAIGYLEYLGTNTYTAKALQKEFYKLGIDYYVSADDDEIHVGLKGLKENLPKGLSLLEHLWSDVKSDTLAYKKYITKIQKYREDAKAQKSNILWKGLMNYGIYGENSRFRDIMQLDEIKNIDPEELVTLIKDLKNYKQRVFYYGKDIDNAVTALNKYHVLPDTLKAYPKAKKYQAIETGGNVLFTDYDMVQAELLFLAKGDKFNIEHIAASRLFNTYFGRGLSSIVFQEIRESKSLAYSAFAGYSNASDKDDDNFVYSYIGTQANKIEEAVDAMMELMNDMPEAQEQFNAAKIATLKKIEAERITKSNIFWNYERLKQLGITYDYREEIYNSIKDMSMADLKVFFNKHIKNQSYNIMVVGDKELLDLNKLEKLGKVKQMDIDYLFNYKN